MNPPIQLSSKNDLTKAQVNAMKPLVRAQLAEKWLVGGPPEGDLVGTYRSIAYATWHFIYSEYDNKRTWLKHWLVCSECGEIRYMVTGTAGTGKLLSHGCNAKFRKAQETNKESMEVNSENDEPDNGVPIVKDVVRTVNIEVSILSEMLADMTILGKQRTLQAKELQPLFGFGSKLDRDGWLVFFFYF